MSALSVWHYGLTVRNLDQSVKFYTLVLGFTVRHIQVQENEYTSTMLGHEAASITIAQLVLPGAPIGASGHHIELIEWTRPRGWSSPLRDFPEITTAHLAVAVADLPGVLERARTFGCGPHSDVQDITAGINKGGRVVFLRDPDGAWLELIEPPSVAGTPEPMLPTVDSRPTS